MKIGLLSDTHGYLDPRLFEYFSEVDEIWHAGDIGDIAIADKLAAFKPFRAVYGNIDTQEARAMYPEHMFVEIGGFRVLMIHIAGAMGSYNPTTRTLIKDLKPDLLVCGHSHILKVAFDQKYNLLYMNPGAAGNHGFHQEKTALKFEIRGNKPENLFLVKLGKRGAIGQ
ncbi:MAG TPA: metallophosphoesterase family protein [Cytophagales bacterium]|nr:metallophosphoesterase family protein [Cytophagales bacterium]